MAITRTYTTEKECAELFIDDNFEAFPTYDLRCKYESSWFEDWYYEGLMDGEDTDEEAEIDTYGMTHEPMWSTWWIPSAYIRDWIVEHKEEVAKCGFTLIFDAEDSELFALGIDGAGYDFYGAHWIPLYRAYGLKWHDEGTEADV